nr:zinc finger protein 346-like isoform X2 [Erigeron canadensis]
MQSACNPGVVNEHMGNDVVVGNKLSENQYPIQCELCNIVCNAEDVLEKHKLGKKHLKNLQKAADQPSMAPIMAPPRPAVAAAAAAVSDVNSSGEVEDKKHKLLQHGAAADTIVYCHICDVACSSQDVFQTHVAGKKHSAKAIMQAASSKGNFNLTSECSLEAQPITGGSQMKPDIPQSFSCELCKISCTSNELLNMHLTGKKHLKKLRKSEPMPDVLLTPVASLETPPTKLMENPESGPSMKVDLHEGKLTRCELCGISCNTYDMLKKHFTGKKHLKNLEKSEKLIGPNPLPATEPVTPPTIIGPSQVPLKEEGKDINLDVSNTKGKRAGNHEDVETKRQKMLQVGGTSNSSRACTLCNVVCNSPSSFESHLAGHKHLAMAMKQADAQSTGQAT